MFFIVGPLRTGSSLLARCLDDHSELLCFCESEINRALWSPYIVEHHFVRMKHHGFTSPEIIRLLDRKRQDELEDTLQWYRQAAEIAQRKWQKSKIVDVGDKSPDFYAFPPLSKFLESTCQLLYSIRDPRAIFRSILQSPNSSIEEMRTRWENLKSNFHVWESRLARNNVLIVKYEDLVNRPGDTMAKVYEHLGVPYCDRFLQPFARPFPSRFLWKTNVDWKTGIRNDFDRERIVSWQQELTNEHLDVISSDRVIRRMMDFFGYEW